MVDPWRVEAECKECGEEYELTSKKHDLEFLKDASAGFIEGTMRYATVFAGNPDADQEAADKVEQRMQKHHNLTKKADGLYCEDCA